MFEFFAILIVTDIIETLQYNLRFFVVPLDGAAEIFCDNKLVIKNSIVTK